MSQKNINKKHAGNKVNNTKKTITNKDGSLPPEEAQPRIHPTMFPSIEKANNDFFKYFGNEFLKSGLKLTQLAREFEKYLLELDANSSLVKSTLKDEERTLCNWYEYFKKIYNGDRKAIDYGTALALKSFFENRNSGLI